MSNAASAIFIPSHFLSPINNRAGSTPYIIASPPPDSPTDSEMAWPHQQMVEHISHIFNMTEDEVQEQFPTNCSLLPIDIPPPCPLSPFIATPSSPTLQYPGTELEHYINPVYPNSPPSVSPSSSINPSMLIIIAEGEQYKNKEEWNNQVIQGPQLHHGSPRLPLTNITPIHQVPLPIQDSTDYKELAMVLYRQVSNQDEKIKAMEKDKENQAPSPTDPQPSTHPGPGWQDNFDATRT